MSIINGFMYCYTFLFIFTPAALYPFANTHLLTVIALSLLCTKYLKSFLTIINLPELRVFIGLQFIIIIYTVIQDTFTSFTSPYYFKYGTAYMSAITIFEVLPCAIFISLFYLTRKNNIINLCNMLLVIGVMQVICVILTLLLPEFRNWTIASFERQYFNDALEMMNAYRMFGLAKGYTFTMPLYQGICVIIAYVLGTYVSAKYYYLIPFYLLSIAVNARVAFISIVIAPIVIFVLQFKRQFLKETYKILIISSIVAGSVLLVKYNAENSSSLNAWVWLYSGFEEIVKLKGGEATGNMESLADTMWFKPGGVDLLFGTGEFVFGRTDQSSDIGYVINLYYGGIVFSLLLYASYTILIMKCIGESLIETSIKYILIIYMYFANLKGNVFTPHDLTNGVIIFSLFTLIYNKQLNNKSVILRH
jgi:hypothetical protein